MHHRQVAVLPSASMRSLYYESHLRQSLSAKHNNAFRNYLLEFSRSALLLVQLPDINLFYNFGGKQHHDNQSTHEGM